MSFFRSRACVTTDKSYDVVASYLANPVFNVLPDAVGSADGSIDNAILSPTMLGDAVRFNGANSRVTLGDVSAFKTGNWTLEYFVTPVGITGEDYLFSSGTGHYGISLVYAGSLIRFRYLNASAGAVAVDTDDDVLLLGAVHHVVHTNEVVGDFVTHRIYVNGAMVADETNPGGWYSTYGTAFNIGSRGSSDYANMLLYKLEIRNTVKNGNWARSKYRELSCAYYATDKVRDTGTVSGGNVGISPFYVGSGSFKAVAPDVIECLTYGVLYLPTRYLGTKQQSAYGRWRLPFVRQSGNIVFSFVAQNRTVGSYRITFPTDGSVGLIETGVGYLFQAHPGVVAAGTKYVLEGTREGYTGKFSLYLDGGLIPAASGSNPVTSNNITTSEYLVLALGVGDRIFGFRKYILA